MWQYIEHIDNHPRYNAEVANRLEAIEESADLKHLSDEDVAKLLWKLADELDSDITSRRLLVN